MWGCCYFLSNEFGELYVGSSINFDTRLSRHKRRKTINMDCLWYWDYLEKGQYESLKELRKREQEYIKQYKDCIINKTKYKGIKQQRKDTYLKHKETRKAEMKEWRDSNKEKILEYRKKYREATISKDKIRERNKRYYETKKNKITT